MVLKLENLIYGSSLAWPGAFPWLPLLSFTSRGSHLAWPPLAKPLPENISVIIYKLCLNDRRYKSVRLSIQGKHPYFVL